MEIIGSRRTPKADDVGSTLPLYRSAPPELEVRLEDFELFAIYRLRGISLLKIRFLLRNI